MPTSAFLIRHGAYEHRPSPAGDTVSDFGLSELGRRQAMALRERLCRSSDIRPDALFCSTMPRAAQTAELIAPSLGLTPRALPELCEWESGNDALGAEEFMRLYRALTPTERRQHRFQTGCETMAEFTHRVQAKLVELLRLYEGKSIALVVHGGVIEVAFSHFIGFGPGPFEGGFPAAGHTSITLWRRSEAHGDWVQEFANDMHHLHSAA